MSDSSKAEDRYFLVLKNHQLKKDIKDLKKLLKGEKADSFILHEGFHVIKNGKKVKKVSIKYTPDFSFFTLREFTLNRTTIIPAGKTVYLEFKGVRFKKKADYSIRLRMFLNMYLDKDNLFVEVIQNNKVNDIVVYRKRK